MPVVYGVPDGEDETLDLVGAMDFAVCCPMCKHYGGGSTCAAFSKGIPADVLSGVRKHTSPIAGDSGIQFEPKDGGGTEDERTKD